ncbi:MAG: hypothetical protein P4L34_13305 [Paludibacter sp.]|nr:hypothetical protein [Paludibacter sp.]
MATGARMPRGIVLFNPYIENVVSYLQEGTPTTNADRLGVLPAEVTKFTEFFTQWEPLYSKYSDKKKSRTTSIKDQLLVIIDNVITFDQTYHILDRIAASPNVTVDDMETFNIKKGVLQKTPRSNSSSIITDQVTVTMQSLGGGIMSIKCYSPTSQRAGIQEDADCVQYLYQVGDPAPVSAMSAGLIKDLSPKAVFTLALGADSALKNLYIYFRWFNTRHPELAGPWSGLQIAGIL